MTNYVIEGNIDFFAEVARETHDDEGADNICLLTGEPLDYNNVVMHCGHTFNYEPLFNEVVLQKSPKYAFAHDTIRLSVNQIKCPYCRRVCSKILPYVPISGCKSKIKGVNSPKVFCMPGKTCSWTFKSGKRKGLVCGCAAYEDKDGIACALHRRSVKVTKPHDESEETKKIYNTRSLHKLKVIELREILRSKKLRVGGRKSELIGRIIASCS